ncbi:MAG: hypothetical protein WCP20_18365 [Desulfuromonadales bacterium]
MQKTRFGLIVLWMLLCPVTFAAAQVSIGIGFPNVSIGINLPVYPEMARVPGYPVYYAPRLDANYFFYDGMYWVYQNDNWYASSWYNGPWGIVEPGAVPLFVLRIPVSYYRQPPPYFRGWQSNAPPRWGQHWGREWEQRRSGWDKWKRGSAPAPAPLPVYQRQYSGDRYPRPDQQHPLRNENYRYQPRDTAVREHLKQQMEQKAPVPPQHGRQEAPPPRGQEQQQESQHSRPPRQGAPADQHPQPQQQDNQHSGQPRQGAPADQHPQPQQQAPRPQDHDRGVSQEPDHGGRGQGQNRDGERGRGRDN